MEQPSVDTGRAIAYQRREWWAQRAGWTVMTLLVLAGFLGLLGNSGPMASAELTAPDGSLAIRYNRLEHHHGPGELVIEVSPAFAVDNEIRLWLDGDSVRRMGIEHILPEPASIEVEPNRLIYTFQTGEQAGPYTIAFAYSHNGFWPEKGRLGLVNGETVEFTQFVFP
jgi:hypothetical protein